MSTELAVLNNQNNLALANQGGLGVDFNDDLFRLKPVSATSHFRSLVKPV